MGCEEYPPSMKFRRNEVASGGFWAHRKGISLLIKNSAFVATFNISLKGNLGTCPWYETLTTQVLHSCSNSLPTGILTAVMTSHSKEST